jgi:MFS family permease
VRASALLSIANGLAGGVVLVAALIVVELRKHTQMIDVRLLTVRLFSSGTTVMTVQSATFLGALFTLTLYFQDERGMTPLAAGVSTFPEAMGVVIGSQLASRLLYRRLGPRRHLMLGAAGTSTAIALMSLWSADTSLWWVRLLLFGMGLAVGQVFVGTQSASFATVSLSASGRASTLFNVGRRLGGALGVAVATTVLASAVGGAATPGDAPDMFGYRAAFLTAAALNLLGLYAARRVNDTEAASTIPPRRPSGRRALRLRRKGDALPSSLHSVPEKTVKTMKTERAEEPQT